MWKVTIDGNGQTVNLFKDLMEQMDAFFNESAKNFNALIKRPLAVRTYETASEVIVEAELPGYKREQIKLEIVGNQLRITADGPFLTGL